MVKGSEQVILSLSDRLGRILLPDIQALEASPYDPMVLR